MADANRPGGLELEEDLAFESREMWASRLGWVVLLAVMAATTLGLFGGGPVSHATAGQPGDPLRVEYARFGRFGSSMRLVVHADPAPDRTVRVTLSSSLVEAFRVTAVTPDPETVRIADEGLAYEFAAASGSSSSQAPIVFELQPARRWAVRGAVSAPERTVRFTQFIYP